MSSKKFLLPNLPDFRALYPVPAPEPGPIYVPEMDFKENRDAPRGRPAGQALFELGRVLLNDTVDDEALLGRVTIFQSRPGLILVRGANLDITEIRPVVGKVLVVPTILHLSADLTVIDRDLVFRHPESVLFPKSSLLYV